MVRAVTEFISESTLAWLARMFVAAGVTATLAAIAFAIGLAFGVVGVWAKLSSYRVLRAAGEFYTSVARGVPELLVIYLLFFGGSAATTFVARLFGYQGYVEVSAFATGALALAVISGAYSTEVLRGAVLAVPKGDLEAARAVGMGRWLCLRRILGPKAIRFALPGLGNVWLQTLKETALISVTGVVELMRQAHIASGSTRQPFLFFTVAALLFLAMTLLSTFGLGTLEDRMHPERRNQK